MEAKAGLLPQGSPSASSRRSPSRESPAVPNTPMGRGGRGRGPVSTGAELNTAKGRTPGDKGHLVRKSATAVAARTPGTPVTGLVKSAHVGGGTETDAEKGKAGGRAGGSSGIRGGGNGRSPTSGVGSTTGNDQTDSDEETMWSDVSTSDHKTNTDEKADADWSSDDDREGSGWGGANWWGEADGPVGDGTAGAQSRPTHKKKVWHAGRSALPTIFGLTRQKNAKIEVLWNVEIRPSGKMEKRWFAGSVDLIDMNRMDHVNGQPLWSINYERRGTVPASKSQVAFLSKDKLRDMLEWDNENHRWESQPLSWRPKQREA